MILAGDIGGTKTVIANYEESGRSLRQVRAATYHSRDYRSLEDILASYLKDSPGAAPRAGCFGVAGTVIDGKCRTTNLPWQLDEQALARAVGAPRVKLLNDLEATGYGILHLPADELCALNPGSRPGRRGNAAVIAAGTGLGEAILYWDGVRHHCPGRATTTSTASCATAGTPRNPRSSPGCYERRTRTRPSRAWGWPARTRCASRRCNCSRRSTAPRPATWR